MANGREIRQAVVLSTLREKCEGMCKQAKRMDYNTVNYAWILPAKVLFLETLGCLCSVDVDSRQWKCRWMKIYFLFVRYKSYSQECQIRHTAVEHTASTQHSYAHTECWLQYLHKYFKVHGLLIKCQNLKWIINIFVFCVYNQIRKPSKFKWMRYSNGIISFETFCLFCKINFSWKYKILKKYSYWHA